MVPFKDNSREGIKMKEELFEELLKSVEEGGKILKGKKKASREFNFDNPDPIGS